ncbi:MAG: sigma-70 family RNA polymerase sigma factor [Christensenellaceae bacterium]|nr:sigma-70 family RNA polymerase sigma factor [Christensenellaceae bacterium]
MFNRKSSYALNKKDDSAIVYIDANENIVRLTREDFASEEEFLKWKSWSDAEYHASEKRDHVHSNHTLALDELSDKATAIPAVDVSIEMEHDRLEQLRCNAELVAQIKELLSDTQFRRLWMYEAEGRTLEYIANYDGVAIASVHESIEGAKKKVLRFFAKHPKKVP